MLAVCYPIRPACLPNPTARQGLVTVWMCTALNSVAVLLSMWNSWWSHCDWNNKMWIYRGMRGTEKKREKEEWGRKQCSHASIKRWQSVTINDRTTAMEMALTRMRIAMRTPWCPFSEQNVLGKYSVVLIVEHGRTESTLNFVPDVLHCCVYVFPFLCTLCSVVSIVPAGALRLPWPRFFRAISLSCKTNARV
jgi:hypothetical protein